MWEYIPFENCLEKTKIKFKLPKKDYKESGKYPVVSQEESLISGYHDNISYIFKVTKPIVVFGDHTLALKYIDFDFIVGADGVKILQPVEEINTKYFYYVLKALVPKTTGYARHYKLLKKLDIPVPPLAEQQRIVAKLDAAFAEIDRAIELTEKNKDNALRYYSHTIDALFSDYESDAETLGNLSTINYGYTAKASHEIGTYRLLRITDIQENAVDWQSVPYCEVEDKKLSRVLLHDGDIVFARTGATTGKSFLVENPKDAVFASYLIRVSVDRKRLIPRYVMHYFQSASYWQQVEEGISGAAQGGFNATKLSDLKIPRVAKDIQQALITKLDEVLVTSKELMAIHTEKVLQLSQLKSAILAQELQPSQSEAA